MERVSSWRKTRRRLSRNRRPRATAPHAASLQRQPRPTDTQGYDVGKRIVYAATPGRTDPHLSIPELAFAGFFSAIPATVVAAPAERIKVLLQVQGQGGKPAYSGPLDVVKKLYAEGGVKSIFRGTIPTILRDGPGSAV